MSLPDRFLQDLLKTRLTDNVPSIETLLACCQGLIATARDSSTVRLVHFTLQEYFKHPPNTIIRRLPHPRQLRSNATEHDRNGGRELLGRCERLLPQNFLGREGTKFPNLFEHGTQCTPNSLIDRLVSANATSTRVPDCCLVMT